MRNLTPIAIIVLAMTIGLVHVVFPTAPERIRYSVDVLIVAMTIFIIPRLIVENSLKLIPVKYIFVLMCFAYVCAAGIVLNGVSGDTSFAGIRNFFRYVPVFLLPFAFEYDERYWRLVLAILLGVALMQLPIAIWQRFFVFEGIFTGDNIVGTFNNAGTISIVSCIAILFVLTWYLCKRLSATRTCLLCISLLIPPSLAEAKVTPILLLVGSAVLVWVLRSRVDIKRMLLLGIVGGLGIFIFTGLYSLLYSRGVDEGYFDRVTDPKRNYHYNDIDTPELEIPKRKHPYLIVQSEPTEVVLEEVDRLGRIDSIVAPFTALGSKAPLHLLLGLGIGNTTSNFGSGADYQHLEADLSGSQTTLSYLIWETGLLGCMLFILFLWFVTRDILGRCVQEGSANILAIALLPTTAVLWVCLAYANLFYEAELMIPFCFLSGLTIANSRRKQSLPSRPVQPERSSLTTSELHSSVRGPSGSTPQHL